MGGEEMTRFKRQPCGAGAVLLGMTAAGILAPGISRGEETLPEVHDARPALQWTLTMENGGGILGGADWSVGEGVYHFGGHVDLLIRRKGPKAWAGGIALTAGSLDMKYFLAGAGVALLVPVSSFLPIIIEAFPTYIRGKDTNSMGVGGRLWWGLHSFNYHSSEVAALGIYMIFQRAVVSDGEEQWLAVWGIDLSLHLVAIPFGMAWQAAFGRR
jgi:hypothetical protein